MAVLKNGLFGGISGRVGNTVYYVVNGRQMSRTVGRVTKPPTPKQLANRQAMKVTIDFLRPIRAFSSIGYTVEAKERKMHPKNAAVSDIKTNALKGEYPFIGIDYSKVSVSKGDMPGLENVSVSVSGNDQDGYALRFEWDVTQKNREWPRSTDDVMLLAYFPEAQLTDEDESGVNRLEAAACTKLDGASRKEGEDVLKLSISPIGRPMEIYVAVISKTRKKTADSQYLGRIEMEGVPL